MPNIIHYILIYNITSDLQRRNLRIQLSMVAADPKLNSLLLILFSELEWSKHILGITKKHICHYIDLNMNVRAITFVGHRQWFMHNKLRWCLTLR